MVNKGGRPKYDVDYATLDALCKIHCTGEECAAILEIDYDTLNRALKRDGHKGFADYFKKRSGSGKASLRRMQWRAAGGGNTGMMVWLGKQYLGQVDKQERDHRSSDGTMTPPSRIERVIVDPKAAKKKAKK